VFSCSRSKGPAEVTDIRPLEPEEIKRTPKQWTDAKVIFNSKGRVEVIPDGVDETFTQEEIIRRAQEKRALGGQSSLPTDLQQAVIDQHSARMQLGGGTTSAPSRSTMAKASSKIDGLEATATPEEDYYININSIQIGKQIGEGCDHMPRC